MIPSRLAAVLTASLAAGLLGLSSPAVARAQDHGGHAHHHTHDHAGGPVDCRTLAAPPWAGLSEADRERIRSLEASLAGLRSPEAAARAGFAPALGNIPTMGVHWVNARRMRGGFRADEPDHLMFVPREGGDELVGVAYAFRGPIDAAVPKAFESELAAWHDHPALGGGPGQTLHMLHVWLVPSPYGPFAGNNFFLPFRGRDVTPPDPCWLTTPEDVERLELVASTLALLDLVEGRDTGSGVARLGAGARFQGGALRQQFGRALERLEGWVAALDIAARHGDREAWTDVATRMLDALSPLERQVVDGLRQRVKGAQTPSASRERPRGGGP
jgi:hypothetical protein